MNVASEIPQPTSGQNTKKKRNLWMGVFAAIFVVIGVVGFVFWVSIVRFYIFTENAYVHGNQVMLTPQVKAGVKAIYADETNLVREGQLVVKLDASDFEIRVEELKK